MAVGRGNGLDDECVVSCDNVVTVPSSALAQQMGYLLDAQAPELADAIRTAFDLA